VHSFQEEMMSGKKPTQQRQDAGQESQHNDWGHSEAGSERNVQSGTRGNIGGVPGGQHNDWGHSVVPTSGPHQGVMPGEEMGHRRRRTD
jgi:hypothetical protein